MDRDLLVLVNTPKQLIVVNPADSFNWFNGIIFGGVLLMVGFLSWKLFRASRWVIGSGLILLAVIIGVFVWSNLRTSYKVTIDHEKNTLVYQTLGSGDDVVDSKELDLSSVKRADMDFNRTHRRIVLTLNNNQQAFPLGRGFDYENSQFEVLDLIRQHIGQVAEKEAPKTDH